MIAKKHTQQAINMDIKNSMALLLHPDPTQQQQSQRNNHSRLIKLKKQSLQRQLDIYAWRYKTSLPFIKPIQYSLNHISKSSSNYQLIASQLPLQKMRKKSLQRQKQGFPQRQYGQSLPEKEEYQLLVRIEEVKCRLTDVGFLPFSQILYLLKEMMIGYDVLIDKFGIFSPSEGMVAVNGGCQWRVWVNEDFTKNGRSEDTIEIGERQFIYRLILFGEKHCISSMLSKTFFGQMKQFTYSKQCDFIKIIDKMKEFINVNKIFQVNKVIFPNKIDKNQTNGNLSSSINDYTNYQTNTKFQINLQKKTSLQCQSQIGGRQTPTNTTMNKSFFNPMIGNDKTNQFGPIKHMPNNALQQSQSQKAFNKSSFFYHPPQVQAGSYQPIYLNSPKLHQNGNKSNQFINNRFPQQPNRTSVISSHTLPFNNLFKSPQMMKPQSPPPQLNLSKNNSSFSYMTKSRHQLKNLLNKKEQSPLKQKSPQKLKSNKPQRKYSEQIFKAKSVDALTAGLKRIHGSNIYDQDPQIKYAGANNIINVHHINNNSPTKINIVSPAISKDNDRSLTQKQAGCSTPNNSSNSTQQVRKSNDKMRGNQSRYQYLKVNDLNSGKTRNNQSSCYGIGRYAQEQKLQKNMAISCSFKNREQISSKSRSVDKQENIIGNQWTKKLSGLFSDDASIKQLKSSVKFKSGQQQRFQKEYLKDVKLDMLQKFGRPVCQCIVVEEEDDIGPVFGNNYKSMQLIEEVVDDEVKSFMEKDQESEEVECSPVRGRNQTVQMNYKTNAVEIEHRECLSYEGSQNQEDDKEVFNFKSESYVINIK